MLPESSFISTLEVNRNLTFGFFCCSEKSEIVKRESCTKHKEEYKRRKSKGRNSMPFNNGELTFSLWSEWKLTVYNLRISILSIFKSFFCRYSDSVLLCKIQRLLSMTHCFLILMRLRHRAIRSN